MKIHEFSINCKQKLYLELLQEPLAETSIRQDLRLYIYKRYNSHTPIQIYLGKGGGFKQPVIGIINDFWLLY
jgi:hypothetical protein